MEEILAEMEQLVEVLDDIMESNLAQLGQLSCFICMPDGSLPAEE